MIENKAIATRESYGNALVEIANEHDDLVEMCIRDRMRTYM